MAQASKELAVPEATTHADHLGHSKVSMTQHRYMTRGWVHTQVPELLDRMVRINDE